MKRPWMLWGGHIGPPVRCCVREVDKAVYLGYYYSMDVEVLPYIRKNVYAI